MRPRVAALAILAAVGAISAPAVATAAKPGKTHHKKGRTLAEKIHAAVLAAERSPDLWATINVCTSGNADGSDEVGIRGQMPSLGFPATLTMVVSVSYWNYTDMKFEPANAASSTVSLGAGTHGLHQGGVNFPFAPPTSGSTYLVRGTVTFEWLSGSKVLGKVTRNTGHGYAGVSFSDPPGYSSGTCSLT
jgi:hypothetical protein